MTVTLDQTVAIELPEFHPNDSVCMCVSDPLADLLTAEVAKKGRVAS